MVVIVYLVVMLHGILVHICDTIMVAILYRVGQNHISGMAGSAHIDISMENGYNHSYSGRNGWSFVCGQ